MPLGKLRTTTVRGESTYDDEQWQIYEHETGKLVKAAGEKPQAAKPKPKPKRKPKAKPAAKDPAIEAAAKNDLKKRNIH